jgi:TonB family protein
MFSSRVFQITLLISIIAHGVVLLQNPNLNLLPSQNKEQKVEVSYVKTPPPAPAEQNIKKEPLLKLPSKITMREKLPPPPFVDKENIFKAGKAPAARDIAFAKPAFIKPDIIPIKKKITLPPIDMDKINNPSYITYYQIVREKIRRAAYQNYTRTETGEVYLTFVISNDGYLKEARLSEEKSSPNPYLREVALKSIKDASPFPNFPKELEYPHLSFNVIISFEIE